MKLLSLASIASLSLSVVTAAIIEPRLYNAPRFPRPSLDPFYRFPDNLASLPKGAIIRDRDVPSFLDPLIKKTTQVLYRTETSDGRPDATVATLFTPYKVAPGPPKILIALLPQDSAAFDCDLSWAQIPWTDSNSTQIVVIPNTPAYYAALAQGWYIVTPGHEGSQASFIAGPGAGKATIDGLRAALNYKSFLPSTAGYKAAIYGYSGGAHGAAWANQLASTAYGSDLNILGAAYGGTVAYLRRTVDFLNKGLFTGFAGAGIVGLMNAHPELDSYVKSILQPNGTAAVAKLRSGAGCTLDELTSFAFKDFFSYVNIPNPLDEPIPQKYIKLNDLGQTVLRKPAFIYHSSTDEVIEFTQLQDYVTDQCSKGAKISFHIADVGPHFVTLVTGLPAAFSWLIKLMDGTLPVLPQCETIRGPFIGLGTPQAVAALGPQAVAASYALNGFKIGGSTIKL